MRWGLLGGTFDPIHFGHLRGAEEMLEIFNLNRIIFVPSSRPPHKLEGEITSFNHREQMIRLAIEDNVNFSFSEVEKLRAGKSYSVETVEYILNKYMKDLELYFIVGQDAFQAVTTWKDWERLLLLCNFAVMTRPGYDDMRLNEILPKEFAEKFTYDEKNDGFNGPTGHTIYFRHVSFLDISSSRMREMVREGKSIKYLAPDKVRQYITKNSLYKKL
ncbi:nicotinate-nucleotide adenylyltransferase [hydrocarbon metagenome]|jgi:nicotinate-nucleotide adenylyltransferase|uniref:Nicotinate-nucleotide adenylyltransferase n=1 Tax=hydrocarbon metagenome TaxID=938273 RepID=A0A0W8FUV2_9ZZZZ